MISCHVRQNLGPIVVGDEVTWEAVNEGKGVVSGIKPRRTTLMRSDRHGEKPLAANVDHLLIMLAPSPAPHTTTLDRYLVLAEHYKIQPLIGVNKIELLCDHRSEYLDRLRFYTDLGYPVFYFSLKTKENLNALMEYLRNKRTIVLGQSGVGKSSLLKTLIPDATIRTQSLSNKTKTGQQTTSTTTLYHLPQGGDLIDSPGIHQFNLNHLLPSMIIQGFKEFIPYLNQCKFRNCEHKQEPGCALLTALAQKKIHDFRLNNFRSILADQDEWI